MVNYFFIKIEYWLYNFFSILSTESAFSRSWDIVFRRIVLIVFSVGKRRSLSTEVIGIVHRIRNSFIDSENDSVRSLLYNNCKILWYYSRVLTITSSLSISLFSESDQKSKFLSFVTHSCFFFFTKLCSFIEKWQWQDFSTTKHPSLRQKQLNFV